MVCQISDGWINGSGNRLLCENFSQRLATETIRGHLDGILFCTEQLSALLGFSKGSEGLIIMASTFTSVGLMTGKHVLFLYRHFMGLIGIKVSPDLFEKLINEDLFK